MMLNLLVAFARDLHGEASFLSETCRRISDMLGGSKQIACHLVTGSHRQLLRMSVGERNRAAGWQGMSHYRLIGTIRVKHTYKS